MTRTIQNTFATVELSIEDWSTIIGCLQAILHQCPKGDFRRSIEQSLAVILHETEGAIYD